MASLPSGFRFAYGLAGMLSGLVLTLIGFIFFLGGSLTVGGGGIGAFIFYFGIVLAVGSPVWYWIGRPIYVAIVGERNAPWYRPPGTLHPNRLIRYSSIGLYSAVGLLLGVIMFAILSGGSGAEILELSQTASNDQFEATVDGYRTATVLTEEFGDETRASSGAVFVLLEIEITNIGETRAEAPGSGLTQDFELQYRDTTTSTTSVSNFSANSQSYTSYSDEVNLFEDNELFPDSSVSGWVVFELPEGFDAGEATLRVEVEAETGSSDVFTWRLGEKEEN
ncbi:DUF4352 domain-containing protein [Haloquadratum walsbyi]|uniref:DUF4352 domain-containing protein n=1 Tax=Haloquadratum walsbyi TaxID=293091 RepID=UPI0023F44A15|nr:DUF4352 domain-containing protein [Haloquadratum walsbyi]